MHKTSHTGNGNMFTNYAHFIIEDKMNPYYRKMMTWQNLGWNTRNGSHCSVIGHIYIRDEDAT